MRIGVDAGCWANDRGYGRFTRELLAEMVRLAPEHEFLFFLDPASASRFQLSGKNVTEIGVKQATSPAEAAAADGNRSPLDMWRFSRAVARVRPDVFFCPSVYTFFPLPPGTTAVVGIHDAIAERFPELTLPSPRARLFWRIKVRLAVFQSRLILSVSDFAADDVARVLRIERSRIRVAVEAPAASFMPATSGDDVLAAASSIGIGKGAAWFTYVGGFNPHKNLVELVTAFAAIAKASDTPVFLVLVGKTDGDVFHGNIGEIKRTSEATDMVDRVIWAGYVPDDRLALLHSGAIALVLPSQCEGFGLPAVEAAACGTPVIATTESPLPQLLKDAGMFVTPGDVEALTDAMSRLLTDGPLRSSLGKTALKRAGELSWSRCARETLDALEEAAA